MITVHLRWILSPNQDFPFIWTLPEETSIGEISKMVIDKNNIWPGNPSFSVVKIYGKEMFLDDSDTLQEAKANEPLFLTFAAG